MFILAMCLTIVAGYCPVCTSTDPPADCAAEDHTVDCGDGEECWRIYRNAVGDVPSVEIVACGGHRKLFYAFKILTF